MEEPQIYEQLFRVFGRVFDEDPVWKTAACPSFGKISGFRSNGLRGSVT
jgi:hypothetical protein